VINTCTHFLELGHSYYLHFYVHNRLSNFLEIWQILAFDDNQIRIDDKQANIQSDSNK